MCDVTVTLQKEVKVYSFRLESPDAQREYTVVDSVKYHSVRRWRGLCCHLHQMSREPRHVSAGRLKVLQIPHT
jgi:hypothetical protein